LIEIDLRNYAKEVRILCLAAKEFVAKESQAVLNGLGESLNYGLEQGDSFKWAIEKPLVTIPSEAYDGKGKSMPPARLSFQFSSELEPAVWRRSKKGRKKGGDSACWKVMSMSTKMQIVSQCSAAGFHVDLKNCEQWGPMVHFQFAESEEHGTGIPRIPFWALLPTDCLDFGLSELFPGVWQKAQLSAFSINSLRTSQARRLEAIADALRSGWKGSPFTPIAYLQDHPVHQGLQFCFGT